jgi:hypothetical protein
MASMDNIDIKHTTWNGSTNMFYSPSVRF